MLARFRLPTIRQLQIRTMATEAKGLDRLLPPKKLTTYKRPFTERKQYLFREYESQFVNSPSIIVLQHHNLNGQEQLECRRDLKLKAQGAHLMIVRSKMVKAVLRHTRFTNLGNLFSGPTAIVYWDNTKTAEGFDLVLAMKQAMNMLKPQRKVILMGGKYEDILLNPAMMKSFVNMPSVDQLRAQLVGVLQTPAQKLASVLGRIPQRLVGVLKQRADGEGSAK